MSFEYTVELLGASEQLAALERYDQIANAELAEAMERSVVVVGGAIRPLMPVGVSGQARQSVGSEVIRDNAGSVVGRVFSDLADPYPYPAVIEFGRAPGAMPPPQALERWVHLKLGVPEAEAPGVAFTIARAIGRRGIKGRFPFKRGWEQVQARVAGFFDAALRRITERLSNGRA